MKRLRNILLDRNDIVSGRIITNVLEKADVDGLVHGVAVAEISRIIGLEYGLGDRGQAELWLAGFLHDIGKLGVPSEILRRKKPGKSDKKYLRKHVTIGKYMADQFFSGGALGRTIEAHHERYDGTGYPHRLKAGDIPWDARVIAIADYYDAARSAGWLLTHRSHDAVMREIRDHSGKYFDPKVVKAALSKSSEIQITHKSIHSASLSELKGWM